MATRYWVGGSGPWSTTSTANWSATSGGASGASAPTSVDDVVFDNLSNVGTTIFTVTITTSAVCRDISFGSGATALDAVMTLAGSAAWSIYGSMTLVSTNLTVTYTGTITWAATTTGKTITTAGKTFSFFTFNGVGGGWTLQDALTLAGSNSSFNLLAGAVDTNNQTVTSSGSSSNFTTSGSATRSLTLGTSTFSCNGLVTAWNVQTTTGFTLSAASSTLSFTYSSSQPMIGGGLTYGTVTMSGSNPSISGANTISTLNLTNTTGATVALSATQTITTFNCTSLTSGITVITLSANQTFTTLNISSSNAAARIFLQSNTLGTTRTITSTTRTVSNAEFRDITFAGSALTGTSLGDCGGNSNITFTAAKTVYWNLAGAQNWSATGWATSSGGSPAAANFPLAQDTAVFDNTGSVTGTITVNNNWNIGTLNITKTGAMTLATIGTTPNIYGNFTLGTTTTLSGTNVIYFSGRSTTQTITSNGRSFTQPVYVQAISSTVSLADNFSSSNFINITHGTFNTSNFAITCSGFFGSASTTRSITLGTSVISVTGTGSIIDFTTVTGLTFSAASSTINLTNNTATARTFNSTNLTYGTVGINGATGSSTTTFVGGGNTFGTISSDKTVANTITFPAAQTNTVTNFNIKGSAGVFVTLNSATVGTQATIASTGGATQSYMDFMSIKDIAFTPASSGTQAIVWYAGTNSVNGGNNTGILFSDTSKKAYLLTSGTSWTVPSDWNSSNNTVYLIGGGGGGIIAASSGNNRAAGGGGGGGGFRSVANYIATPGGTVTYAIGAGGVSTAGGSTTFSSGTYTAGGGGVGTATTAPTSAGGAGGTGLFTGGTGGAGAFGTTALFGYGGGGGGGAGGPLGNGGNGGNGFATNNTGTFSGGGGGGNGGGTAGTTGSTSVGGTGGNNASGVGGGGSATSGTAGGGGGGGTSGGFTGGSGGAGIDIFNTIGGGGGCGGQSTNGTAFGGNYGGGGGGGVVDTNGTTYPGSVTSGRQGVVFIVYSVANSNFLQFMNAR